MAEDRWERLSRLYGECGFSKLSNATVAVLGVGGVGSNATIALARSAVGNIILVDSDLVSESNINRQAEAFTSSIDRPKVQVMSEIIRDINEECNVKVIQKFILSEDVEGLIEEIGETDYIIDAIDSIAVKLKLAEIAQEKHLKLISSMGVANKTQMSSIKIDDIYNTVNDPIARIMRKEARKRGIKHLKVSYSDEVPQKVETELNWERGERLNLGTTSYMPAIMGFYIAGYVHREIDGE